MSRVFGIFAEELVRIWADDPHCPYEDLGRPTITKRGDTSRSTLDFTLHHKASRKVFVAELKCEIEYQGYKYLTLSDVQQLDHHNKAAFDALLDSARAPTEQRVLVKGKEVRIDGAILIWGATTPEGRRAVMREKGFFNVLAMTNIINDLRSWRPELYCQFVEDRRSWTTDLFDALLDECPSD
ncbi:hypothetical protein [Paraburkholderia sacchari]|uniref:hypothetical protein n=1 Tax=Paraburkholderia sacchari TaxID=159450 RepID=UPI0039A77F1B